MTYRVQRALATIQMRIETMTRGEAGQGLSEYVLILLLVSIGAFAALNLLGAQIVSLLSNSAERL
jgi:hypothetical protein